MTIDEKYMRMAINLARRAEGLANPNPAVGAVVVKDGKVIGKGYHKRCGLPHAEVLALKDAGLRAKGATLYVTLEPCDHFGRTPPCTGAIVRAGIKRVVMAMKDPNPINNGRGTRRLVKRAIKTATGILQEEAKALNRPYVKFITTGMPFVTVKVAQSIDGKIATKTGESKWITSDDAREFVHDLRAKVDAVMVGSNTAIRDDPLLLTRSPKGRQPVRVVVDSRGRVSGDARVFSRTDESPVIIATARKRGARVDLKGLLKKLGEMGIIHVLVEGGGELIASLVEKRLADQFLFFVAPKIIGGRDALTSVEGVGIKHLSESLALKDLKIRKFKRDILIEASAKACSQVL